MFNKKVQYRLPKSVDEAAELLLSDLLLQHLQTLVQMSEDEYDRLCDKLAPYLLDEFRIWQGNNDLLDSCYNDCEDETVDPTRVILDRIKKMLQDLNGFLVIT
jgi:predicted metal-binding transcription factor (methanogenesis marker protein 9)